MKRRIIISLNLFFLVISFISNAQQFKSGKYFLNTKGVAMSGYDAVAYHTLHKAIKGNEKFVVKSNNITYYFNSKENKNLFIANPEKYKPAYGGYCAYGFGFRDEGSAYPRGRYQTDPNTFKIIKGKLYLFYDNNYLNLWNKEEAFFLKRSDEMWKKTKND